MRKFNHFNIIAPFYDRIIKAGQIDIILSKIVQFNNGLFLDAGGGTGRISKEFVNMAKGVIVADNSWRMLIQAKSNQNLIPLCTNVELLPFFNEAFDLVFLIDALHHITKQKSAILELWRVVRPGGCLLIQEPDIETLAGKAIAFFEKILLMKSHFLTSRKILDVLINERCKCVLEKIDNSFYIIAIKN